MTAGSVVGVALMPAFSKVFVPDDGEMVLAAPVAGSSFVIVVLLELIALIEVLVVLTAAGEALGDGCFGVFKRVGML